MAGPWVVKKGVPRNGAPASPVAQGAQQEPHKVLNGAKRDKAIEQY